MVQTLARLVTNWQNRFLQSCLTENKTYMTKHWHCKLPLAVLIPGPKIHYWHHAGGQFVPPETMKSTFWMNHLIIGVLVEAGVLDCMRKALVRVSVGVVEEGRTSVLVTCGGMLVGPCVVLF